MGTIDNIFVLHGLISHTLSKNKYLFCAFVDFTKAFDYVVRDILWYKLIKMGVRGKILNVVMSMYKHIKSQVKLDCNIRVLTVNLVYDKENVYLLSFSLCTSMISRMSFI